MKNYRLLEVDGLHTQFHTESGIIKAVDGVSFSLNEGQTLGIVGESGSGKSVTALSIMRLIPEHSGSIPEGNIRFVSRTKGEVDLVKISQNEIRKLRGNEIAMIFQEPMSSLNPVYTCGNQVIESIRLHQKVSRKEAREKTLELFREVQLDRPEKLLKSYPHQLSGGQKQRVMIAMAISCNPSVLIADEPTTALDVTVQKTILELLEKLQADHGMSVIFISHDLGVIAEIADHVGVMYKGKIVEKGNIYDIFSDPQHPYTKGLLACRPPLDKRLRKLPTMASFSTETESGEWKPVEKSISETFQDLAYPETERKKHLKSLYRSNPILEVKEVSTHFPLEKGLFGNIKQNLKAVDQVSFDVYQGEIMGLVGESGCGKTTLGRTLLRLEEASGGKAYFEEQDIFNLKYAALRKLRKKMQIIFQDPYSSLNPRMTVGKAIMEPMQVHQLHKNDKERKQKVFELLEQVNLSPSHFNRYPHEFSGGQRQRICIARALAVNPSFIVCDESVSALDVSIQAQVLNLLLELKKQYNLTYIFISHDLSVVKFMADRLMVMKDGKIIEKGDAEKVYRHPENNYTQKLIDAIPKGRLKDIKAAIKRRQTAQPV